MRYMHNIDTHRSKRQILEELQVAATRASEDHDISHMTLIFAVLLVKLSDQAEQATRNLIWLRRLLFLLVILLTIMILPPIIQVLYGFLTENTFTWTGPNPPDFSRFWSWSGDLWAQFRDWVSDLWKESRG
jgi:hypothetical protein